MIKKYLEDNLLHILPLGNKELDKNALLKLKNAHIESLKIANLEVLYYDKNKCHLVQEDSLLALDKTDTRINKTYLSKSALAEPFRSLAL